VRVLVSSLVSLTLMAERLHDRVARNEPVDPNWVIQSTQTIVRLLAELGLKPVEVDRPPSSLLSNYLKEAAE
jgi:hypothetical protein